MIENGFPLKFVDASIKKTLNRYIDKINKINVSDGEKKNEIKPIKDPPKNEIILLDIPYFGKPSEILSKRLISLAKLARPQTHLQPIPRPPRSIGSHFSSKDPIPKDLQSGVIYQINCSSCDVSYIGKTIRQVKKRLEEHGAPQFNITKPKLSSLSKKSPIPDTTNLRRSARNAGKIINYSDDKNSFDEENIKNIRQSSVITQNELETGHQINGNDWHILTNDPRSYRLEVRESLA
ncbi:unnamed protein product, partial [Rotaria magnacalcarata]